MSNITEVTEANFEPEVANAGKLVLIKFTASWCGPCKALTPTLEKFAAERADVKVVVVDIDKSPVLAQIFGIRSVPTLITFNEVRALFGMTGNVPRKAIDALIDKSFAAINNPPPPSTDNKGPNI